jgi:hypothetical protein
VHTGGADLQLYCFGNHFRLRCRETNGSEQLERHLLHGWHGRNWHQWRVAVGKAMNIHPSIIPLMIVLGLMFVDLLAAEILSRE